MASRLSEPKLDFVSLKCQSQANEDETFLKKKTLEVYQDKFETLDHVRKALKNAGMEKCGLIFGIDFTMSNNKQGAKTFNGRRLHDTTGQNPYQEVICILGETLEHLDSDGFIPVYGFGDRKVTDKDVFPLKVDGECNGFAEVLEVYIEATKNIELGGPTNFAPLINRAVEIVKKKKQYHILVIIADGQITNEVETVESIVKASEYPLSIIVIGVGDGPWHIMEEFDDKLPERNFDNFQFVDFHKVYSNAKNPDAAVALAALMEIPDQYTFIRSNGLLDRL